jgi:hypothetical protein
VLRPFFLGHLRTQPDDDDDDDDQEEDQEEPSADTLAMQQQMGKNWQAQSKTAAKADAPPPPRTSTMKAAAKADAPPPPSSSSSSSSTQPDDDDDDDQEEGQEEDSKERSNKKKGAYWKGKPLELKRGLLEKLSKSKHPLSIFLPKNAGGLDDFARRWRKLPCATLPPVTEKHVYGELNNGSLWKIWFAIRNLVDLTPNDVFGDWGCGTGKMGLAVTYFSPFPNMVKVLVESDRRAYKALRANLEAFKKSHHKDVKNNQVCLTSRPVYPKSCTNSPTTHTHNQSINQSIN